MRPKFSYQIATAAEEKSFGGRWAALLSALYRYGAALGSHAIVRSDVPPGMLAACVPARVVGPAGGAA